MTHSDSSSQKEAFLSGEGDAYFLRNRDTHSDALSDPWNAEIATFVRPGGSILEIGCSDGRRLAAIRHHVGAGCSFSGVDPSAKAIEMGRQLYPEFDLRVGTSDDTGLSDPFDLVLFGFCPYLCERTRLLHSIAHVDSLIKPGGLLCIIDFDPIVPSKRQYAHHEGLWSYKMDYAAPFLSIPGYSLELKRSRDHSSLEERAEVPSDLRMGLWIIRKSATDPYITVIAED